MFFRRNEFFAAVLAAAAACFPAGAAAESSHVRAKLLADVKSVQPGTSFRAGILLEMDPGWHTYWVNPGEAGLATRARWKLPQGLEEGPLLWPAPEKFEDGGTVSYGYAGRVLLAAEIRASSDLGVFDPAVLRVRVDWMECADVCVPGGADLKLELPVKIVPPDADENARAEFARADAAMPAEQSSWRVSLTESPGEWRLMFRPPLGTPCLDKKVVFYPDRPGLVPPAAPQKWEWLGDGCRLNLKKATLTDRPGVFSGLVVRSDGWDAEGARRALRIQLPVK